MLNFRLKQLRKKNSLTQSHVACKLNITQQAVAKWEAGLSFPEPEMLIRLAELFNTSVDYLLGHKNGFGAQMIPCGDFKQVPVAGAVRAGFGQDAFEDHQGTEPADISDPENYFYLTVQGDSMEPFIREGDLALVRRQNTLQNGELGVIIYGAGEGALKRFYLEDGKVLLKSFNPSYETLVLSDDQLEDLYIVGRVVETKTRW